MLSRGQTAVGRECCCGVFTVSGEVGSADWVAVATSGRVGCIWSVDLQVAMWLGLGVVA